VVTSAGSLSPVALQPRKSASNQYRVPASGAGCGAFVASGKSAAKAVPLNASAAKTRAIVRKIVSWNRTPQILQSIFGNNCHLAATGGDFNRCFTAFADAGLFPLLAV
jgi:hypothetical protein